MRKSKANIDLTTGNTFSLFKKVLLFSIPVVLVGCLEILFNTFDLIVIEGRYGENESDAVGGNAAMIALLTNVFLGLSAGENVVISRYYGEGDFQKVNRTMYSGLILAILSGLFIAIVGYCITPYLLKLMQVSSVYIHLAEKYLRIYFLAMPFVSFYNFGSAIFRGIGDSTKPLIFLIIAGVIHIALNYLFVYAFNMSVEGVSISNIISYIVASILVIIFIKRETDVLDFKIRNIRIYKKEMLEILKVGIPSGIQGMIFAVSNIILQSSVNQWDTLVVQANANSESIENFSYTSMLAVGQAGSAFISANYGKGDNKNVRKLFFIVQGIVIGVGLIIGMSLLALNRPLVYAYSNGRASERLYELCFERLSLLLPTYILCGMMDGMTNSLRGVNRATIPMIISIFFVCVFRIFWNFVVYSNDINSPFHSTIMLYLCYPASWILSFSFQLIYLLQQKKKIVSEINNNKNELAEEKI